MPGCYKCGTQQKVLISLTTTLPDTKGKPQIGSYALCDKCAEDHKEDAKK